MPAVSQEDDHGRIQVENSGERCGGRNREKDQHTALLYMCIVHVHVHTLQCIYCTCTCVHALACWISPSIAVANKIFKHGSDGGGA